MKHSFGKVYKRFPEQRKSLTETLEVNAERI